LVLGAILAVVVILLFLHNLRGTFIVALAIPTCIVTTFLMMGLAGFTLNQMTLLALSLSVGILVDDSIVILESITRHLRYGEMPREAALNGRSEIGFADTTTTLVDVVVFVPLAFMGGVVGGFFRQFGLTIAFATLFSLIVSFSVTPMLAARWYRPGEDFEAKRGLFGWFERRYRGLENRYGRVIEWALSHRIWVLLGGVGALAAIFLLSFHRLGGEFLPGADQGSLEVRIEMPPGTSLAATDAVAQQVDRMVAELPEVEATASNVGQIVGSFDQLPQQGAQFAQIRVRLKEKRQRSDQEVAAALRAAMPSIATQAGATIQVAAIRSVIGVASPLELRLRGPQIAPLAAFGQRALETMRATPGILNADISTRQGKPETRAVIDPQRAAQFGIPTAQAGAILRDSIAGHRAGVYRENGAEFPIRVRLVNTERDDPVTIGNIIVGSEFSGSGPQPVRLADIADIVAEAGPTNIERLNGMRLVRLTAGIAPGYALENVRRSVERQLRTLPHEGITWEWGGEAATIDENVGPFVWALGLAVLLVYIVMAALFNNLGTPFVIMFTLPMALIGALGALVLTGETLSLISAIGIVMLFGLMGRNAILLLDYTNTLRARGQTRNAALIEAGRTRLRPILMTTTATIVGMLPVALRFGQAAELRAPMAIVVIGGLLVSTILTLVVIPVLYSLFDDGFGGRKKKESALNERT
jgi:HAE1 family hydrophobic/amphiphilic exporter-1